MRLRKWYVVVPLALILVAVGVFGYQSEHGLSEAQNLAGFGLWSEVRGSLQRYLWLHPGDERAHLLFAESLVKDDEIPGEEAVEDAIRHLQKIPDSSPHGSAVRNQEGQLNFLLLHRPAAAERLFRKAIELNPSNENAYYMLWKLLDQTGRSHLAEDAFWHVYELSGPTERVQHLRSWYMSQFFPATANPILDRLMGFEGMATTAPDEREAYRFLGFRNAEPKAPLGHAALARWFHLEGDPRGALKLLDSKADEIEGEEHDSFYLATLISILVDLGEPQRAKAAFDNWPEDQKTDYEYWTTKARVSFEILDDLQQAVDAYGHALQMWPGQVDWRTRHLKATCLRRLGKTDEATVEQNKCSNIQHLMANEVQERLRDSMGYLGDADRLQEVVDFYTGIDRKREAKCWAEHVAWLLAGNQKLENTN